MISVFSPRGVYIFPSRGKHLPLQGKIEIDIILDNEI
jgi:hypothetical protein